MKVRVTDCFGKVASRVLVLGGRSQRLFQIQVGEASREKVGNHYSKQI